MDRPNGSDFNAISDGAASNPNPNLSAPTKVGNDPHEKYAATLTNEERQLILLRVELYNNSWETMLADLDDRLKGQPYIFKLVKRIEEDVQRIHKLQSYERKHQIDLFNYLRIA